MAKQRKKTEAQVIEGMMKAHAIGEAVFGDKIDCYGTVEIYEYLDEADEQGEKEFAEDLKRMYAACKAIYKTETPDTEQVFDLLGRVLLD